MLTKWVSVGVVKAEVLSSTLLCPYSNSTDCRSAHWPAYARECVHRRPHICRLYSLQVRKDCTRDLQCTSCTGCLHIVQGARISAYAGECLRYAKCNSRRRPMHLFICCPQITSHLPDIDNILQGVPKQSYCSPVALKLQVTFQKYR